jgi:putative transposase
MPAYGYRRMTHELPRRGFVVHHHRGLRLMREGHLLGPRNRRWVQTTTVQQGLAFAPTLSPE